MDRGVKKKFARSDGKLFRVARQMKEWSEHPGRWWMFSRDMGLVTPRGTQPLDFVVKVDDFVIGTQIRCYCDERPPRLQRVLTLGSDRYKAHEIPPEVLDEAKRAIFGEEVPEVIPWTSESGDSWWEMRAAFFSPHVVEVVRA